MRSLAGFFYKKEQTNESRIRLTVTCQTCKLRVLSDSLIWVPE